MEEMEPFGEESRDGAGRSEGVRLVGSAATPGRARRVAVVGGLAAVASAVVAASSSGLVSRLHGEVPGVSIGVVLGVVVAVLLAAMLVGFVGLAYLTWVERAPRRRGAEPAVLVEEEPERGPMEWWTTLLLPLLFTSLICLGIALGWLFGRPGASESPTASIPRVRPQPGALSGGEAGGWPVHWLMFVVLSSVGGGVAAMLLVRDWRRRRSVARLSGAEEMVVAVDESLDELESEPDSRVAVIKAYGRMERALAAQGIERRPPETPLEYLARALGELPVSRGSIAQLTSLFQWAKFSHHAIDTAMKHEAIAALRKLRAELARFPLAGATR